MADYGQDKYGAYRYDFMDEYGHRRKIYAQESPDLFAWIGQVMDLETDIDSVLDGLLEFYQWGDTRSKEDVRTIDELLDYIRTISEKRHTGGLG